MLLIYSIWIRIWLPHGNYCASKCLKSALNCKSRGLCWLRHRKKRREFDQIVFQSSDEKQTYYVIWRWLNILNTFRGTRNNSLKILISILSIDEFLLWIDSKINNEIKTLNNSILCSNCHSFFKFDRYANYIIWKKNQTNYSLYLLFVLTCFG